MKLNRFFNGVGRAIAFLVALPIYVLALPFWILIWTVIFTGTGIAFLIFTPRMLAENRKWKESLREQGRLDKLLTKSEKYRTGTLIVDSCTPSWGTQMCWWTPEEIRTLAPQDSAIYESFEDRFHDVEMRMKEVDGDKRAELARLFDHWLYARYLHPERGTAVLLASGKGDRFAERLSRDCPRLDVVFTWSGLAGCHATSENTDAAVDADEIGED